MMQNCDARVFSCNLSLKFPAERESFLKVVFISLISCLKKVRFRRVWVWGPFYMLQFCDNGNSLFVKKRAILSRSHPGTVGKSRESGEKALQ